MRSLPRKDLRSQMRNGMNHNFPGGGWAKSDGGEDSIRRRMGSSEGGWDTKKRDPRKVDGGVSSIEPKEWEVLVAFRKAGKR